MDVVVLTFDVYGTVVDWRGSILAELRAFGSAKRLSVDWERFLAEWKASYQPGMEKVNSGEWPWTTVDAIYRRRLEELLPAYGITGVSEVDVQRELRRDGPPGEACAAPVGLHHHGGERALLQAAAGGVSNRPPAPGPVRGRGHDGGAAHNYDLRAAQALGMRTAFFPRPSEYGPGQTTNLAPDGPWDVVATDLEDLARALGA